MMMMMVVVVVMMMMMVVVVVVLMVMVMAMLRMLLMLRMMMLVVVFPQLPPWAKARAEPANAQARVLLRALSPSEQCRAIRLGCRGPGGHEALFEVLCRLGELARQTLQLGLACHLPQQRFELRKRQAP